MGDKHGFRIVGEEDALLTSCEGETVDGVLGIYEDLATKCPRCGDLLVLRVGRSHVEALPLETPQALVWPVPGTIKGATDEA